MRRSQMRSESEHITNSKNRIVRHELPRISVKIGEVARMKRDRASGSIQLHANTPHARTPRDVSDNFSVSISHHPTIRTWMKLHAISDMKKYMRL